MIKKEKPLYLDTFETIGCKYIENLGCTNIVLSDKNIIIRTIDLKDKKNRKIKIIYKYKLDKNIPINSRDFNLFIIYFINGFNVKNDIKLSNLDIYKEACEKYLNILNNSINNYL
jgi:hypothetical protein